MTHGQGLFLSWQCWSKSAKSFRNELGMVRGNRKIQDPLVMVLMPCCGRFGISNLICKYRDPWVGVYVLGCGQFGH